MQVNRISQTINFKSLNALKGKQKTSKTKNENSDKCEPTGIAELDSNGVIKVCTRLKNTLDSNMWYELDKTGTAKIYSCWTEPGKETIATKEALKGLYKSTCQKFSENGGNLNSEDSLWLANRIECLVYDY